jgi:hypothetical protein
MKLDDLNHGVSPHTSQKQIVANRSNALRSTRPKTATGKALVARNSVAHGIYALSPVIEALESKRSWTRYRAEMWDSLAPSGIGGHLGMASDRLRMLLPPDCPPELKDAIRQHRSALLELLRLDFLVVRSDTLNATVFWTPDEATKESLAAAGADLGSIYTASELEHLVHQRITTSELSLIHAAKQRFGGKLTP